MGLVLLIVHLGAIAALKPFPALSNNFVLHSVEVDDTANESISVTQTIIHNNNQNRSRMIADGTLAQGHMEQDVRLDVLHGYFLDIHGEADSAPASWQCANQSMTSFTFGDFWGVSPNATLAGQEIINGTSCDKWVYWSDNEQYAIWIASDTTPMRSGKIFTQHPGYHLWHLEFTDFKTFDGQEGVPLSYFELPDGIKCGNAPAPVPPTPWTNSSDCKACAKGSRCCSDPAARGKGNGACYNVPACSDIHDGSEHEEQLRSALLDQSTKGGTVRGKSKQRQQHWVSSLGDLVQRTNERLLASTGEH
jgi:hypothetical protein